MQRFPAPIPSASAFHGLAYDAAHGRSVLFGGQAWGSGVAETWEYGPVESASHEMFGAGCMGSAGVPTLRAGPDQRPWLGESFRIDVTNLPPSAAAVLLFGSSRSLWGSVRLPFGLDALGMTGCSLASSGEWLMPLQVSAGAVSLMIAIPNDPRLVGRSFFQQACVSDPAANRAGITTSNACEGKIGAK